MEEAIKKLSRLEKKKERLLKAAKPLMEAMNQPGATVYDVRKYESFCIRFNNLTRLMDKVYQQICTGVPMQELRSFVEEKLEEEYESSSEDGYVPGQRLPKASARRDI